MEEQTISEMKLEGYRFDSGIQHASRFSGKRSLTYWIGNTIEVKYKESKQGRMEDALALRGDEGRDYLR